MKLFLDRVVLETDRDIEVGDTVTLSFVGKATRVAADEAVLTISEYAVVSVAGAEPSEVSVRPGALES